MQSFVSLYFRAGISTISVRCFNPHFSTSQINSSYWISHDKFLSLSSHPILGGKVRIDFYNKNYCSFYYQLDFVTPGSCQMRHFSEGYPVDTELSQCSAFWTPCKLTLYYEVLLRDAFFGNLSSCSHNHLQLLKPALFVDTCAYQALSFLSRALIDSLAIDYLVYLFNERQFESFINSKLLNQNSTVTKVDIHARDSGLTCLY